MTDTLENLNMLLEKIKSMSVEEFVESIEEMDMDGPVEECYRNLERMLIYGEEIVTCIDGELVTIALGFQP